MLFLKLVYIYQGGIQMERKIILILLFSLLIAVFAIQNATIVPVRFFTWEKEISLAFILLGAIVLGALLMGLVSSFRYLKQVKERKKLERNNKELSDEMEAQGKTIRILREQINSEKDINKDINKNIDKNIDKKIDKNKKINPVKED